jgi:arsenate reductase
MAHGFLQSFDDRLTVCSAGTVPATKVNKMAIRVMMAAGIDISHHTPKLVDQYLNEEWDYLITVCGHANETCPLFAGKVKTRLHIGFEDPSDKTGTEEFILSEFCRVRDLIRDHFYELYSKKIKPEIK